MAVLRRLWWLIALVGLVWGLQIINLITGYALNRWFGLLPRTLSGLDGILFMPLLHGSLAHVAANTAPLAILGALVAATAHRVALLSSAIIVGLGGLGVWLFGNTAIHIGASGLIFGWFGFLIARGFMERRPVPLLIALGVAVVYGAMLWGVLPGQPGVSWEAHLFGALAGVVAARVTQSRRSGL
ncbi:rhomboid family intramembrane serine protease [Marivita sp. S2033]|uniref:rhomboid family intramembrane serine protease n=1 Tax=Marivita sp. S2033 TaxID=3373187 RepID=UPI00398270A3